MDFSLGYTPEQEEFALEVNDWLDHNIPDGLQNYRDTVRMSREQWEKRRELGRRLGGKGWLHPGYPPEYGSAGLDADHTFVICRELGKRNIGLPPFSDNGRLAAPAILACGTDEQKKKFLPPMMKGESYTWQLFTEPEAGTDEANQQTNALQSERSGEYFIVNGQKVFVGSLYPPPDQFLLLTRSDPRAPRHANLAMFLAPADLPGITIMPLDLFVSGNIRQITGEAADNAPGVKYQVFFDDVRVHESYLIGGEREGWRVVNATLEVEQGGTAGRGGGGRAGQDIARNFLVASFLEQCRNDPLVRRRLQDIPRLADIMVEVYLQSEIERLFALRNTWLASAGKRLPYVGRQFGLHQKLFGARITSELADVLGPAVFNPEIEDHPEGNIFEVVERCGLCTAPAGTPEALKVSIARALKIGR